MVDHVLAGLGLVLDPYVLGVVLASGLFGLFIGAIPGLTATMAVALLVPVTFFLPPIPAVACIVTATAMTIFAGDIPGALLRMPGTPASAAYCDEAYAMTRRGEAGTALGPASCSPWLAVSSARSCWSPSRRRWRKPRSPSVPSSTSGSCCSG
jgi:putative tricarboxylic transport membrane protein